MAFRRYNHAPADPAYDDVPAGPATTPARWVAYDLSRALTTLLAAGVAGGLIWLAGAYVGMHTVNDFWVSMGIVAGAGLVMALSQLVGGWTKWGAPRLSAPFFVLAFLPVLVVTGWILMANQPGNGWHEGRIVNWSQNLGILDVVHDFRLFLPALAFGFGLVLGYCFDTTGLRRPAVVAEPAPPVAATAPVDRAAADEPVTAERTALHDSAYDRDRELVGTPPGRRVEIREGGAAPRPDRTDTPERMD